MEKKKLSYENPEIEILELVNSDILTSLSDPNVDQDGWI